MTKPQLLIYMSKSLKTYPRLSFLFNPAIAPFKELGEYLIGKYNGVPEPEADILVPIGGDGSVLYALPYAKQRMVYGIVPKESNSIAYTVNQYDDMEDLHQCIEDAEKIRIHPLDVKIQYADGTSSQHDVFNSVNLARDEGQAALMKLTGTFNGAAETIRVMGDGIAFSTPLGSTGLNYSHAGPILSYSDPAMILTGMGIATPRGLNPIVSRAQGESFSVDCIVSNGKRPLRLDIDGRAIRPAFDNPIKTMNVSVNWNETQILAVKKGTFHPFKRLGLA